MRSFALETASATADEIEGLIAAHDIPRPAGTKGMAFRKGQILTAADLASVRSLDQATIHVVRRESDDVSEDEAGRRLVTAVGGDGLSIKGPSQSRYNLVARHRGLVRIDVSRLNAINAIDGMAVFSVYDRQPVDAGDVVAGAKIAPLCIGVSRLVEVERIVATSDVGVIRIAGFTSVRIATMYREKLVTAARERFAEAVKRKAAWFGSTADEITPVSDDPAEIAATLRGFVATGAGLIFAAGGSSTDPLDATIEALDRAGARLVRRGVPVHPGSMFWLADLDGVPVVSLASCSLFTQTTIVDLVVPRLLAGECVDAAALAALGHGGLMERGMDWRFPPYARGGAMRDAASA